MEELELQTTNSSKNVTLSASRKLLFLLTVIITAVIFGGIGYMLGLHYITPQIARLYAKPTPTPVPQAAHALSPSTGPYITGTPEQDSIKEWVTKFYKLWIVQFYGRDTNPLVSQGYLTNKAAVAITSDVGSDLPTCSQNPLQPNMYMYSTPIITGNTASMNLQGSYGTPQEPTFVAIYLNLVKVGSVWSIDSFTCAEPK